ncbi:MAG: ribosome biogenesis GTP-binding protein YihA/YsxC [Pseudomonadota bacterium]|jgi:GTP-binding protein|nr:ribosome biogenesis GTP-binding protein YihA/YsxC [Pseudomonadota bacterium]
MKTQKIKEIGDNPGEWLFNQKINFELGVTSVEKLPENEIPEIAFFGRSNVGKSSLLNAITKKSKLAYTSKNPGRTQELNYFSISNGGTILNIVDMPGYGFAKASKDKIRKWNNLSKYYLKNRQNLRRVFLLIDSRRNIKPVDEEVMNVMDEFAVSYQIVLTKIDKTKDVDNQIKIVLNKVKKRRAIYPNVIATSSKEKLGIEDVKSQIASLIE